MLVSLGAWNWLILAVVLLVLETVVPGVHFLWFGLAAIVVGVLGLAIGIAWPWQVLIFLALSVAVVFWVKRFVRPDVALSDQPNLNVRGQQYVGRSVVVEQAIENGRGKVRVGDTLWSAEGPDVRRRRERHRDRNQGHRAGGEAGVAVSDRPTRHPGRSGARQRRAALRAGTSCDSRDEVPESFGLRPQLPG